MWSLCEPDSLAPLYITGSSAKDPTATVIYVSIHSLIHIRVLLELPVCPDLPAPLVVDMMSLDMMSTELISPL